jgi:hypothetical protein
MAPAVRVSPCASVRSSADSPRDARLLCPSPRSSPWHGRPPHDGSRQRHDVVVGIHADVAILQQVLADEACMDAARDGSQTMTAMQLGTARRKTPAYSARAMKQPAVVPVVGRDTGSPAVERNGRLEWGLSAWLPRWRAFDGRRSRVAINWTGSTRRLLMPSRIEKDRLPVARPMAARRGGPPGERDA